MPRGIATKTKQDKLDIIDAKIQKLQDSITKLKAERKTIEKQDATKAETKQLMDALKLKGMTIDDLIKTIETMPATVAE